MEDNTQIDTERPRCIRCAHHRITHDPSFPYACTALDFKSVREPMKDVIEASGQPCLYFTPKADPARR